MGIDAALEIAVPRQHGADDEPPAVHGGADDTGLALLAGSTGRDFIEILLLSVLLIVPMMIPAGAALFPGTAATWIRVLPSYGMTEAIVRSVAYGAGWAETAPYFFMTLAW